jgi:hypothetical protein
MLRQIQKINNKIMSNNFFYYSFLLLVCYNYYSLYSYLLDKNYNIVIFYFTYLFLLYSFFNIFSYFITFITIIIFKVLNFDNYIKNSYIIENHEPASVQNYRTQLRQQRRRQYRQRDSRYQTGVVGGNQSIQGAGNDEEESLEARIERAANERGKKIEDEARGVTSDTPPDPAYQYILAHLPDCNKDMLSLNSLPH